MHVHVRPSAELGAELSRSVQVAGERAALVHGNEEQASTSAAHSNTKELSQTEEQCG